jgi:hypothetical protein
MADIVIEDSALEAFLDNGFVELPYDPSRLAKYVPIITAGMRRLSDDPVAQRLMAERKIRKDEVG